MCQCVNILRILYNFCRRHRYGVFLAFLFFVTLIVMVVLYFSMIIPIDVVVYGVVGWMVFLLYHPPVKKHWSSRKSRQNLYLSDRKRVSTQQERRMRTLNVDSDLMHEGRNVRRILPAFRPQPDYTRPSTLAVSGESARQLQSGPASSLFDTQRQLAESSAAQDSPRRRIPRIVIYPEPRRPIRRYELDEQRTSLGNLGASTSRDTTESYRDDSSYRTPLRLSARSLINLGASTSRDTTESYHDDSSSRTPPRRLSPTSQQTSFPARLSPERCTVVDVHHSPSKSEDGSPGKRSISSSKGSEGSPSSNIGSDASHCSDDSTKASKGSPSSNRASDCSPENSDDSDTPVKSKSAKVQKRSAVDDVARDLLGTSGKDCSKRTQKRKVLKQSSRETQKSSTGASNILDKEAADESLEPACSDAHPKKKAKSESKKSSNVPSTPIHSTVISSLRSCLKAENLSSPKKRKKSIAEVHRTGVKGCDPPLEKKPKTTSGSSSESESEV